MDRVTVDRPDLVVAYCFMGICVLGFVFVFPVLVAVYGLKKEGSPSLRHREFGEGYRKFALLILAATPFMQGWWVALIALFWWFVVPITMGGYYAAAAEAHERGEKFP